MDAAPDACKDARSLSLRIAALNFASIHTTSNVLTIGIPLTSELYTSFVRAR